ncbi:MAG: DUF11 domain-containing protein, partial [Gemmatimonadota bacterium]|nr:DUF11 domain-containing protein [Gemmatimonadota bacterium]
VLSHVLDGPTYERSRIGLAWRDLTTNNWNGLFRYEHKYEQRPLGSLNDPVPGASLDGVGQGSTGTQNVLENLDLTRTAHVVSGHINYRASDRFTFSGQYGAKVVEEDVGEEDGDAERASLVGARIIYDLGAGFDVGLTGWALRTGSLVPAGGSFNLDEEPISPQNRYAVGAELGWSPIDNLRIAGGYVGFGFIEDDILPDQPTDQGFYARVGYKIDRLWGDRVEPPLPRADISVSKIGPERTVVDRPTEYWVFPRNDGPARARSVEVEDQLPPGSQVLEASEGAEIVGDTVRWRLGDLEPGLGPSQYVRVAFPDTGQAVDVARVESRSPDPQLDNNAYRHTTHVVPYALRIEKSGPEDALPDDSVAYSITVWNEGPRDADRVIVTDSLPVGAVFGRADQDGVYENGVVVWPSRPLAAGDSMTVSLVVSYPLAGRYSNVARVNAPIDPDRDVHEIEVGLPADARLTVQGRTRAVTGDTVTYYLNVLNEGPGTARNARLQVHVPPRGRVVAVDTAATVFGGRVAWSLGSLPPGDERALELGVVFDSVGLYPMEARVFTDFDDRSESDRRTVVTQVFDWDLDVDITGVVQAGTRMVEYLIRTHNRGPGPAPYVVVEDSVAPGGTIVSGSRDVVDEGDVARWPEIDTLLGGGTRLDTLRVSYAEDGLYSAVAMASADGYTVTDRIESLVGLPADVRIHKFGSLTAAAGDTLEYALWVINSGNGVARRVAVVDSVPAGAEIVSST